ncbi:MAG TPA: type I glyceraldehyde-3-phosphate dehydrogenase, partial [Anaerolineae bacterium]|nr:type I glyceraldehyde-3-phosphate dehydrogenase [Anaerolineae bacterium]
IRVAINGFGRIGRQVFKIIHQRYADELRITHIGVSNPHATEARALLLKYDSNYGTFDADVEASVRGGKNSIVVDGHETHIVGRNPYGPVPEWARLGIDLVIESSGHFKGRSHLHLTGGARRVIVTAPDSKADLTVVVGINHTDYDPASHRVISNASCTTNCLAPVAKVLHENLGIKVALMTTIHAYTGSQPVLDHVTMDPRRSRSAATNIVPTSTGAARAVAEVIPELSGKLNGCAYRVPIPTVSIAELVAHVERPAEVATINAAFEQAAAEPPLLGVLGYSPLPLVSTDFQGTTYSSVLDALSTMCLGEMAKVAAWYDNEWGYACRVAELAHYLVERGF